MYPIIKVRKKKFSKERERKRYLSAYPPLENNGGRLKKWAFN